MVDSIGEEIGISPVNIYFFITKHIKREGGWLMVRFNVLQSLLVLILKAPKMKIAEFVNCVEPSYLDLNTICCQVFEFLI